MDEHSESKENDKNENQMKKKKKTGGETNDYNYIYFVDLPNMC